MSSAIIVSQVLTGVAVAASVALSIINLSSPTGLWQTVNLLQMFLLVLLMKIYLPLEIRSYILSNGFSLFVFDYPFIDKVGFLKEILDKSEFSQSNQRLSDLEVNYEITFSN